MIHIQSDHIAELNAKDLQTLVGLLCEAEVRNMGQSVSCVTWGGKLSTTDEGIDVHVRLQENSIVDEFIPNRECIFQVKKSSVAPRKIESEMKKRGEIRRVIRKLESVGGAYVIVSSGDSLTKGRIERREMRMKNILMEGNGKSNIKVRFYDSDQIARWVRRYSGLCHWVRDKIGRPMDGWRGYGAWCGGAEDEESEYLHDQKLRLHFDGQDRAPCNVQDGIARMREELTIPKKVLRLIGLSGVGKTRLVQALFDERIGDDALGKEYSVYTNLSDSPMPKPSVLADRLISASKRAILVVDNCPPEEHSRLVEVCTANKSCLSVITIEYDISEDQPESTKVIIMRESSEDMVSRLISQRYPCISITDTREISKFSGGNARIAILLAGTVKSTDSIGRLRSRDLFCKLFEQKNRSEGGLLLVAQATSLLYQVNVGKSDKSGENEIKRIACISGQGEDGVMRCLNILRRRGLVQEREDWRAILPLAIANKLAHDALAEISIPSIHRNLVQNGSERMRLSFSQRLSFLHESEQAIKIAREWLSEGGMLGNVGGLKENERKMLKYLAPVDPELALQALERVGKNGAESDRAVWLCYQDLVLSLAYSKDLFSRCTKILSEAIQYCEENNETVELIRNFSSLFTLKLSGTHATINQRLEVIERLLLADNRKENSLGLSALKATLTFGNFTASRNFGFGARSRNFGYLPRDEKEKKKWYCEAILMVGKIARRNTAITSQVRSLFASYFCGLWSSTPAYKEAESMLRELAGNDFWREGWEACRETLRLRKNNFGADKFSELSALEKEFRPSSAQDKIKYFLLTDWPENFEDVDMSTDDAGTGTSVNQLGAIACDLGSDAAINSEVFKNVIPELLRNGKNFAWQFGRGLAIAARCRESMWDELVYQVKKIYPEKCNMKILSGYLAEVNEQEKSLSRKLLAKVLANQAQKPFFALLEAPVEIDEHGISRIEESLNQDSIPIADFAILAYSKFAAGLPVDALPKLVRDISNRDGGQPVALQILSEWLAPNTTSDPELHDALLRVGCELLQTADFGWDNAYNNFLMATVADACLRHQGAENLARNIAGKLRKSISQDITCLSANTYLMKALFASQPCAVLDAFFDENKYSKRDCLGVFRYIDTNPDNPTDIMSLDVIISWCQKKPSRRFPAVASFISFCNNPSELSPKKWTERAIAVLKSAPAFLEVLEVFIVRFQPISWSGSRYEIMENYSRLLDDLCQSVEPEKRELIQEKKRLFQEKINLEKSWESKLKRSCNRGFE